MFKLEGEKSYRNFANHSICDVELIEEKGANQNVMESNSRSVFLVKGTYNQRIKAWRIVHRSACAIVSQDIGIVIKKYREKNSATKKRKKLEI